MSRTMTVKFDRFLPIILLLIVGCTKYPFSFSEPETGTFTDNRDKQEYLWIKIGDQVWMDQNLNVKTTTGSWCYENDSSNCDLYGRLYDWETALSVCPLGWHLPSEEEWTVLEDSIGGLAGKRMKSRKYWINGNGNNLSGFNALPAGGYYLNSGFSALGEYAFFWAATEYGNSDARGRYLGAGGDHVGWSHFYKMDGFSVRCLKDQ